MRNYCVSIFVGTPSVDTLEADFNFEYPADAKAAAVARLAALNQAKSALDFSNRLYAMSEAELQASAALQRRELRAVRFERVENLEMVDVLANNAAHACHVAFWESDLGNERGNLLARIGAPKSVVQQELARKEAGVMPFAGTPNCPDWDLLVSRRAGFQFECHYFSVVLLFRVVLFFDGDEDRGCFAPACVSGDKVLVSVC